MQQAVIQPLLSDSLWQTTKKSRMQTHYCFASVPEEDWGAEAIKKSGDAEPPNWLLPEDPQVGGRVESRRRSRSSPQHPELSRAHVRVVPRPVVAIPTPERGASLSRTGNLLSFRV